MFEAASVHGAALVCFFALALLKECAHVSVRHNLSWSGIKHLLGATSGEAMYGFAIHMVVYSGLFLRHSVS